MTLLLLALVTPSWAQDDSPWGETPGAEEPAPSGPWDAPADTPWTDEQAAPANEPPPVTSPPPPAPLPSLGQAPDVRLGQRTGSLAVGTGVTLDQTFVIGGDGGTSVTTADVHWGMDDWVLGAQIPWAVFRSGDARGTGVGNLGLEAMRVTQRGSVDQAIGVEAHLGLRGGAWTWAHAAEDLWPGTGIAGVYQRQWNDSPVRPFLRAALGFHGTPGVAPLPGFYVKAEATGGVDVPLSDAVGVVGEATAAWYDTSPLLATGLLRVTPSNGLALRTGMSLPLGAWMGGTPGMPAGLREMAFHFNLSLAR